MTAEEELPSVRPLPEYYEPERRLEMIVDGEEVVLGSLGNYPILGSVRQGRDVWEAMEGYLPPGMPLPEIQEGLPFMMRSPVFYQSAAESALRDLGFHQRVASPEQILAFTEEAANLGRDVWSDLGFVLYSNVDGPNREMACMLEKELVDKNDLKRQGRSPVFVYGLGVKPDRNMPLGARLEYLPGWTKVRKSPGLEMKFNMESCRVISLDYLLKGNILKVNGESNEAWSSYVEAIGVTKHASQRDKSSFTKENSLNRGLYVLTSFNGGVNLHPYLNDPIWLSDGSGSRKVEKEHGRIIVAPRK